MPSLVTRRSKLLRKLATLTFALTLLSLTASDASARWGEGIHAYFAQFYGQDYYDGQPGHDIIHRDHSRQFHAGHYGPPIMYGRQYGDEHGNVTDRACTLPLRSRGTGYGGDYFPR